MSNAELEDEAWKTFAKGAPRLDPGATITHARVSATAVTLPELPLLAVARLAAAGSPAAPPAAEAAGVDFEVTGVLGEGGMGRVLLARQRSLRRDVAIKIVKDEHAHGQAVDTLLAEAIVTGAIEHPGVIPVHVLGRDAEGRPVLVMKRIEGVSWRTLARDPGHPLWSTLAPEAADRLDAHLEIFMSVCNAAHCAHARGFVHRDLKLDNVMIGSFGEVYLVDWGIAVRASGDRTRRGERGALTGTPSYMAPEMVRGDVEHIDARTDVYLLGATLHALLTGAPRHRGESLLEVLVSARDSDPFAYPPDVPAELAAICNRAMSAAQEARFASARDLRLAVASFRRHEGSVALSDEAAARLAEIPAGGDPRRVHGMLTGCRFGFMQALRAWPENAAAEAGLTTCLEQMIEHEITQHDAEGALALLTELGAPRPALAARIEALQAELRAAAEREIRLRAMERDRDLTIGGGAQLALVGLLPVFATGVIVFVLGRGDRPLALGQALGVPLATVAILLLGVAGARRHLRTQISRKAIALVVLVPVTITLHRALIAMLHAGVPAMFVGDLVLMASTCAAFAITLVPRFGWAMVPYLVGAPAIALWPDLCVPIFAVVMASGVSLLVVLWWRAVRTA